MKISKKKPYITSSVTTVKSSSIKGFPRFTVTDEQRIEATPKRNVARSSRAGGAKSAEKQDFRHFFYEFCLAGGYAYILNIRLEKRIFAYSMEDYFAKNWLVCLLLPTYYYLSWNRKISVALLSRMW